MSERDALLITKATGELEPFDVDRLRASLERSGASSEMSAMIADAVLPKIQQGMSTRKLYRMAFNLLKQRSKNLAARYRLKQAIMDLGPSGFPFERFVARILEFDGFTTQVGVTLNGRCVTHEVDVVADRDGKHHLVECKYHNSHGRFCDVKVPLYIQARFTDISEGWQADGKDPRVFQQGWVVTNTRFTTDAIKYGECVGLKLMGWDHPRKGNLKDRIDNSGLYPLTCMINLTKAEKERLLAQDLVLVHDIVKEPDALARAMVKPERVAAVLKEADELSAHLVHDEQ